MRDVAMQRTTTVTNEATRSSGSMTREVTYSQAIREALAEEMRRDESVFIMGEDIGVYGGFRRHVGFNFRVRPGQSDGHTVVGSGHRRGGHRRGRSRHAPRSRSAVFLLSNHRCRPAGEPSGQNALHVRRQSAVPEWCARRLVRGQVPQRSIRKAWRRGSCTFPA